MMNNYVNFTEKTYLTRVSESLLLNVNSAIFQLYYGENKLIFNAMMTKYAMHFHIVKMYKDKEVKKNVKDIFLSMCDVKIFLTFTSPNMVLL